MEINFEQHVLPCILLVGCILSAWFVPTISSPTKKRWVSTLLGLVGSLGLCGLWGTFHLVLMAVVNSAVVLGGSKRCCFVVSFFYSFAQLSFYNAEFLFPWLPAQKETCYLTMMVIVFKMINLAGEVQDVYLSEHKEKDTPTRMKVYSVLSFYDVMHYAFCHVGITTFFRYRTYYDWLHFPPCPRAKCWDMTISRCKDMAKVMAITGVISLVWPLDYVLSPEYLHDTWYNRLFYATYAGLTAYMFLYFFFMGGEIICLSSGMGAYPSVTNPKPGRGPTKRLDLLDEIELNSNLAELEGYKLDNFDTVRNIYVRGSLFAPTFRVFWKNYNMCSQYVLAEHVYRRFPFHKYRMVVTFFVSNLWHGFFMARLVGTFCFVFYIIAEDILYKIFMKNSTGVKARLIGSIFWASNFFANSYVFFMMICFKRYDLFYDFIASIWFLPVVYSFAMLMIALRLRHNRNIDILLEVVPRKGGKLVTRTIIYEKELK